MNEGEFVDNLIINVMKIANLTSFEEAKAIVSCFGYELDDNFVPITATIDGWEQTGLSPYQFHEQFKDLLEG